MEKNVTPNKEIQKPSFFKTFIYVFSLFLIFNMLFGKKKEELPTINPLTPKTAPITRSMILEQVRKSHLT